MKILILFKWTETINMRDNFGFIIFLDSLPLGSYSFIISVCVHCKVSYAIRYNKTIIDWIFG